MGERLTGGLTVLLLRGGAMAAVARMKVLWNFKILCAA